MMERGAHMGTYHSHGNGKSFRRSQVVWTEAFPLNTCDVNMDEYNAALCE